MKVNLKRRLLSIITGVPYHIPDNEREWMVFPLKEAVSLIKRSSEGMHSPYYTNPCSRQCKVCNMDKPLYQKAKA